MIEIYRAANPMMAHLLKGILESEGITAAVVGEFGFNVRGEAPITTETLPRVCVENEADVERAREIAESFDTQEPLEGVELEGDFLALDDPEPPET